MNATVHEQKQADNSALLEMADKLYKNLKMGTDAITSLLPKVTGKSEKIRSDMTSQLEGYESMAKRVRAILNDASVTPKEEKLMVKMSSKIGMAMNTMIDASPSHIAEMMIEGSTMAITDTIKLKHQYEHSADGKSEVMKIADELISFEQNNIEKMKEYL